MSRRFVAAPLAALVDSCLALLSRAHTSVACTLVWQLVDFGMPPKPRNGIWGGSCASHGMMCALVLRPAFALVVGGRYLNRMFAAPWCGFVVWPACVGFDDTRER